MKISLQHSLTNQVQLFLIVTKTTRYENPMKKSHKLITESIKEKFPLESFLVSYISYLKCHYLQFNSFILVYNFLTESPTILNYLTGNFSKN